MSSVDQGKVDLFKVRVSARVRELIIGVNEHEIDKGITGRSVGDLRRPRWIVLDRRYEDAA